MSERKVRCNVIVPAALWAEFEQVAKAHYRSRSDHIRFLMSEAVKQHREANRGLGQAAS